MQKLISLRRAFGVASCAFALFAVSAATEAGAVAPDNSCPRAAVEYCSLYYETGTDEFATCVTNYKIAFCPADPVIPPRK